MSTTGAPDQAAVEYHPILGLTRATGTSERSQQDKTAEEPDSPIQQLLSQADAHRAPDATDFDAAFSAYARVLDEEPANVRAMDGLINVGVRGSMDWQTLWHRAKTFEKARNREKRPVRRPLREALNELFADQAHGTAIVPVLTEMRESARLGKGLHPAVEGLVAARQMSLGHLGLAFAQRRDTARAAVERLQNVDAGNPAKFRRRLAALLYAGRPKTALKLAQQAVETTRETGGRSAQQIQKLAADLALFTGDVEPHLALTQKAREQMPLPGEDLLARLVTGKRVAVVGPADTGDALGEVIDRFDVIVRTQYAPDFVNAHTETLGSRTDIAYYSGRDLTAAAQDLPGIVEAGGLKLVVARPGDRTRHAELASESPDWLRFYRQDSSLYFHGRPLGVPRMVYDLLQFRPQEIGLFNIDLYSGARWFAGGYREEKQSVFAPHSIMNDLLIVHDLLTDFRFLEALRRSGAVVGYGASGKVLSMSEEEYVTQLEKGGAFA